MGSIGIVFVNSERGVAGGLTSALDLAGGLRDAGHRITVVCHPDSELRRRLDHLAIPVAPVAIRAELNAWRAVQIAGVLRRTAPDVVLADRRKDVKLSFGALRLAPGAALVHRHGAPSPLRDGATYRAIWSRLDGIIVNSEAMRRLLLDRTPWIARVPVDVIHNGKDLEYWRPRPEQRGAAREALGIDAGGFVVAYHGVLQPRKNVDALLRACAAVGGAHALIIGAGPDEARLRELAASLDVPVTFTGRRDDVPALLAAADVAIHLSEAEGFSNSVVEALACGLPVIASDATSHREQIENGRTGVLVQPGSIEAVASALGSLRGDAGLRRSMAGAARETALDRFGIDQMVDAYAQALLRATNRP